MDIRDARLVDRVTARPFPGYARHPGARIEDVTGRVAACVALLLTMVLSSILLGSAGRVSPGR